MSLPEKRIRQFLVMGSDSGMYTPKPYEMVVTPKPLLCIDELVANGNEEKIVAVLIDAAKSKLTDPFFLAYAVALCLKSESLHLKQAVYANFTSICFSSEVLFNFVRCLSIIARSFSQENQKIGCKCFDYFCLL